jgi:hypothetical protein
MNSTICRVQQPVPQDSTAANCGHVEHASVRSDLGNVLDGDLVARGRRVIGLEIEQIEPVSS